MQVITALGINISFKWKSVSFNLEASVMHYYTHTHTHTHTHFEMKTESPFRNATLSLKSSLTEKPQKCSNSGLFGGGGNFSVGKKWKCVFFQSKGLTEYCIFRMWAVKYPICFKLWPKQVFVRSKAWVFGCLLAGIAGLNPTGSMDVVPYECCVLSVRDLCFGLLTRPEESYHLWCVSLRVFVKLV